MARLYFLLLLLAPPLLLLQSAPTATAVDSLYHTCGGNNYTATSSFQSNLQSLLASLSSSSSSSNFSTDIKGDWDSEKTYGLVMCRGDVDPNNCTECIKAASSNITQLCPQSMKAIVWYDYCQLRYSDTLFFTNSSNDGQIVGMVNTGTQQDPGTFMATAKELMGKVADYAARNSSLLFATGMFKYRSDLPAIYGLAQCTRNLSADACSQCLQGLLTYHWSDSYAAQRGGRILGYSCNFRYEAYTFFTGDPTISFDTTISQSPAPSPAPILSPPPIAPTPTVETESQSGKGKPVSHA